MRALKFKFFRRGRKRKEEHFEKPKPLAKGQDRHIVGGLLKKPPVPKDPGASHFFRNYPGVVELVERAKKQSDGKKTSISIDVLYESWKVRLWFRFESFDGPWSQEYYHFEPLWVVPQEYLFLPPDY